MKKKKIILIISIVVILLLTVGVSLAVYTYTKEGSNQELVLGDIYMKYTESNGITLSNAYPSENYDNTEYFEFSISGKNTYTEKDIWYDITLLYGDDISNKTRLKDKFLKFTLIEIKDGKEITVVDGMSYSDLKNKKLYINTITKNTTNDVKITYRLYMWISSDVVIGNNNQDYTIDEWEDVYASIKVKVNGDFSEKTINVELTTEEKLIETAVSYSVASSSDFSGGLVAINTDGTLYDETDSQQEIREYRYTGLDVNNYIFLDTDGDEEESNNEIWRIVGIFKNSEGEWNLKLMRNTVLEIDETPKNYTYEGTSYIIRYSDSSNNVYLNSVNTAVNESDWTTAKLQYWLNDTTTNGYYGTLSNSIQNIIDTNYTYYLGNNIYGSSGDTTISSYTNERLETNIWSGNKATWNGAIGLLYPSDYGYSANSSYWSDTVLYYYSSKARSTSWMYQSSNHSSDEWLMSPASSYSYNSTIWTKIGYIGHIGSDIGQKDFRPVLNLLANSVSLDGLGTIDDAYKISL